MWFTSSGDTSAPKPALTADGTPIAPNRSQRSDCWLARDAYFDCLDKHNIVNSIAEADQANNNCGPEGRAFEANCATSWVKYFKQKRVMEYKKEKTLEKMRVEGVEGVPVDSGPGKAAPPTSS